MAEFESDKYQGKESHPGVCGKVFQELRPTLEKFDNVKFHDVDNLIPVDYLHDHGKIIILSQIGDLLELEQIKPILDENLLYFQRTGKKKNYFVVLTAYEYNLDDYKLYSDILKIYFVPSWYGTYSEIIKVDPNDLNVDIKRKFLSLNGRASLLRTSLFAYFYRKKYLSQSIFSYNGYRYGPETKDQIPFEWLAQFFDRGVDYYLNFHKFDHLQNSKISRQEFLANIPYTVDKDQVLPGGDAGTQEVSWHNDCYCNLVTETYTGKHNPFFTEKIFKPIATKQIFMIFGAKRSLDFLHKLGFRTFHPFIDESYDHHDQPQRFNMLLDNIDSIASIVDYKILNNSKLELKEILDHNYENFYTVLPKKYKQDIANVAQDLDVLIYNEQQNIDNSN